MAKLFPKVSIIGCGNVGMRYAYSMIIKGVARELCLVDYNRNKAEGEAMDLSHGAPYVSPKIEACMLLESTLQCLPIRYLNLAESSTVTEPIISFAGLPEILYVI